MTYLDGFVIPCPRDRKDRFIAHASFGNSMFIDLGALRVVECWGVDVKPGHTTDFQGAVDAQEDEEVVFSWIEWPDKATRDAGMAKLMDPAFKDPRMDQEANPMPFDGKRMIFGGFQAIVERGDWQPGSYVQGFMIPVPETKQEAYRQMAEEAWAMFADYGATRVVEAWGDDVPHGEQTDFYRGVKAQPDERVVFSYMAWPSRDVADAAHTRMQTDERMQMPEGFEMPFDGKRMVWGGFIPVYELEQGG